MSANGNVGPAKSWGWSNQVSLRLNKLKLPNAVVSASLDLFDSEITDPFLGTKRRQPGNGRWSLNMGFRHDLTQQAFTYGFNYSNNSNGGEGREEIDIIDIEERIESPYLSAYVEKQAFGSMTFRLESNNITDNEFCRKRTRFIGATVDGVVEEIENYCNGNGLELALKIRATF